MVSAATLPVLSPAEGYRYGARRYDSEPNPMLMLERRYLEALLPRAAGLDVVDLGCGTGRWLDILSGADPRSLVGIEPSVEMLRQAKKKLKTAARLIQGDGATASLGAASSDLVLANFVLSYAEDARAFLANARFALRNTGSLFLTDIHPATSAT